MKPPCIRNLPTFSEGCPEREWNGHEGCPAWIEKVAPTTGEPLKKENHKMCLDLWQFKMSWDLMGHSESYVRAIEMLRNGLLFYDEKTKTVSPKPDYAIRELVSMLKAIHREQLIQIEEEGTEELKRLAAGG